MQIRARSVREFDVSFTEFDMGVFCSILRDGLKEGIFSPEEEHWARLFLQEMTRV
jgi:hypothetical protein